MKELKNGILLFVALSLLTGVLYPAAVTVLAQLMFPQQANGSILSRADGTPIGSSLIGQPFSDQKYFRPRPSATADFAYNALASGGSNLGPTNENLIKQVEERVKGLREDGAQSAVPADLVMASGSGLDPHISPVAAEYQVKRVAKARGLDESRVRSLVAAHTEKRQFGVLGDARVNVLTLNLALDEPGQR
jgi:K+-transporting ATPase ATPase C chain